jgi:hypothetical protein
MTGTHDYSIKMYRHMTGTHDCSIRCPEI